MRKEMDTKRGKKWTQNEERNGHQMKIRISRPSSGSWQGETNETAPFEKDSSRNPALFDSLSLSLVCNSLLSLQNRSCITYTWRNREMLMRVNEPVCCVDDVQGEEKDGDSIGENEICNYMMNWKGKGKRERRERQGREGRQLVTSWEFVARGGTFTLPHFSYARV